MSDHTITLLAKLQSRLGQRRAESVFDEEVTTHLEMLAEKYVREA
jgi:hypothetical protein